MKLKKGARLKIDLYHQSFRGFRALRTTGEVIGPHPKKMNAVIVKTQDSHWGRDYPSAFMHVTGSGWLEWIGETGGHRPHFMVVLETE